MKIYGVRAWSWKRACGMTAAKVKLNKATGMFSFTRRKPSMRNLNKRLAKGLDYFTNGDER